MIDPRKTTMTVSITRVLRDLDRDVMQVWVYSEGRMEPVTVELPINFFEADFDRWWKHVGGLIKDEFTPRKVAE